MIFFKIQQEIIVWRQQSLAICLNPALVLAGCRTLGEKHHSCETLSTVKLGMTYHIGLLDRLETNHI